MSGLLSTLAYGLLARALHISLGHYVPAALALVCAALGIVTLALAVRWPCRADLIARRLSAPVLGVVVTLGFAGLLSTPPGLFLVPGTRLTAFGAGVTAAAVLALGYAWPRLPHARLRFGLIVGIYLALGVWVIRASPAPPIDVWHFQQRAVELLLQGQNPYASFYPNIYANTSLYGSGYLKDGRVYSFTYPPLVILLGLPGWLLGGDVRYSLLAAVAGAACFTVAVGRRTGLPPGHHAELAAVALLFHPRGFHLIEMGWVDPYWVLAAAAALWSLAGQRPAGSWIPLGLLLAAKQHTVLWLPPFLASRRLAPRAAILGGLLAAGIAVPFLAWSPSDFWRGLVLTQVTSPFRQDAISVLSFVAHRTGIEPPAVIGFVAAALMAALAIRSGAGPGREAIGAAAVFLAFFVFGKQAFFNYYWAVGVLLLLATVSEIARDSARACDGRRGVPATDAEAAGS